MRKHEIVCKFTNDWDIYTCVIINKIISEKSTLEIIGKHLESKSHQDVESISFNYCTLTKVPQGLIKIFPNLKNIFIFKSKLPFIQRDDLKEYSKLIKLSFKENEIEYLAGDLFADMKNLEWISFEFNKLKLVEPKLLDGLEKLKFVNFRNNPSIDKVYDSKIKEFKYGAASLKEIRENFSHLKKQFTKNNKKSKIFKIFNFRRSHKNKECSAALLPITQKEVIIDDIDGEFKFHNTDLVQQKSFEDEMIEIMDTKLSNFRAKYKVLIH